MAKFLTKLKTEDLSDKVACLIEPLIYESDLLKCTITIPIGFQTDFASVPRFPVVYWFWGGRSHHEAVLHDYLYRIDSEPYCEYSQANEAFLEAMEAQGKSFGVRYPMYWGVVLGGWTSYHKQFVLEKLFKGGT